jgi:archaellum biogenesis ATPase FlaH
MRLLKYGANGDLSIAEFDEDTKPAYAILSHRWGAEADEVTFEDVVENTGKNKPGYAKIRFCGEQAQRDGLQYFWVDTCCINKANKAELSLAIQSMFRWYRNSARCYVYLSDVLSRPLDTTPVCNPQASELQRTDQFTWIWILLFIHPVFRWYHFMLQRFFVLLNVSSPQAYESKEVQKSEWFTRGWTLQELLAPSSVEFFSREWEKLGDKRSLIQQVQEVTGIPRLALQGASLSEFSINKRLRWIEHRRTTHPEDKVYSLLGVVDVDLAPCYGEGVDGAFRRLHDEIDKTKRCIQDLCSTDSHADKKRIEDTKGGLLKDSYRWVLHNDSFRQWHEDPQSRLLWIKGDPGKGKTMLLCGIIDELQASSTIAKTNTVSYFFCQATDARINSATAVLRGLLYMLVKQQPSLAPHVRKKYDEAGKNLFEDANAWVALVDIFTEVLRDPSLTTTYLIVDALDECVTDLPKLLDFVATQSSASSRVKWIVSSRNWPEIEGRLKQAGHKVRLSLELNAASVSTAVQAYIEQKTSELAQQNKYDERTKRAVLKHLTSNANDTFLWVALVCQHLQATARRNVLMKLELFPPGLDALYERMMQQISKTDDARLCKQVLAAVALVYRPIVLKELVTLVEPLESIADDSELQEVISLCGSFLTLREQTVYFVHQSAKDFLLAKAAQDVFPTGQEAVHQVIFARSLQIMSTALRRDMYGLKALGTPIDDVVVPTPDPLAALRYACVHWVDHLCDSNPTSSATYAECLRGGGVVDRFLREKCLYWLESLSLCKSMSRGVVSVRELQMLVQVCPQQVTYETSFILTVARDRGRRLYSHSLYTMCIDLSCTTNKLSRVALFRHMDLRCCSVQSKA